MRHVAGWFGAAVVGLVLGAVSMLWLGSSRPQADAVQRLRSQLALETNARIDLEERLEELEQDLTYLSNMLAMTDLGTEEEAEPPKPSVARAPGPKQAPAADANSEATGPSFDSHVLAAAGLEPARIEAIKSDWERQLLVRLTLSNRAIREGWFRSRRYSSENREVESEFRKAIGELDYEYLLYATGRPTRLIARDVLADSSASRAGLVPGDAILRYDGQRVFRPSDLKWATATSEPSSDVWIEILRADDVRRLSVPGGPLGVVLTAKSLPPLEH